MKKTVLTIALGFPLILLILLVEMVVTLPLGSAGGASSDLAPRINIELALVSIPGALATFALAALMRAKSRVEALCLGAAWMLMLAAAYLFIGIFNGTLGYILGSWGFYTLLLCVFAGPLLLVSVRRRKKRKDD